MDNEIDAPLDTSDLKHLKLLAQRVRETYPTPSDPPDSPAKKGFFDFTWSVQATIMAMIAGITAMAGWGFNTIIGYHDMADRVTHNAAQVEQLINDKKDLNDQLNTIRNSLLQVREMIAKNQDAANTTNIQQEKEISGLDKSIAIMQERMDERLGPKPHTEQERPEKFGSLDPSALFSSDRSEVPQLGVPISAPERDHP